MTDTVLTHSVIAQRALFYLKNELTLTGNVFKGYNTEFKSIGRYQAGSSVTIHLPNKSRPTSGATISLVDTSEKSTTVSVDEHYHDALDFTTVQMTQDIESFWQKYMVPKIIGLANKVDELGASEYVNIYNSVGTPGTTPSTYGVLADAAARMDEEAVPQSSRVAVFSPKASWSMADGELKSVFQQKVVDTMLRKGFRGEFALMEIFMDQNITNHTTGTQATRADGTGTVQVKTTSSEGDTSIALKGLTASTGTITQGDILTFASVAGVNPVSGAAWEGNALRQFVATATATADASGDATVSVSPAIISSAQTSKDLPYQTVNDLPAANDNVTISGSASTAYMQNLLFHPECFAMTMVPFDTPMSAGASVKWATATDQDLGLAIAIATGYDISNYKEITRADILFGWDTPRPELGVRLWGG